VIFRVQIQIRTITKPQNSTPFIYAQDREQTFYSFNDSCLKGKTGYTPAGNIPAV